jgi:hypothetical protein
VCTGREAESGPHWETRLCVPDVTRGAPYCSFSDVSSSSD